jgi:hypothetical protein
LCTANRYSNMKTPIFRAKRSHPSQISFILSIAKLFVSGKKKQTDRRTERRKRVHSVSLTKKKGTQLKHFLLFPPSSRKGVSSETGKEEESTDHSLSFSTTKNEAKHLQKGRATEGRNSNIERRHWQHHRRST